MYVGAFLENALLYAAVAPLLGFVMALLSAATKPLREALRVFAQFTALFAGMGAIAALPTLLTGEERILAPAPCPRALVGGPSCF